MTQKKMGAGQGAHINYIQSSADDTAAAVCASNEIIIRRADGALFVDSPSIATEFGRRHDNVLRTLDGLLADGTIDRLSIEEISYVDEANRPQRAYRLSERAALVSVPFIGGRRSREGQRRIVDAFLHYRSIAIAAQPAAPDLTNPGVLLGLLETHARQSLQLQHQVAALEPKAQALDRLECADGALCITDAAKNLKVSPRKLFGWLSCNQWIYRRGASWVAYQAVIARGLLEHRVTVVPRHDGSEVVSTQVRVTPKGLTTLATELAALA
ncbi:phage antirepressor KilAC domain-containing protein [Pandoraea pulmonicola]|uniref:Uncharacterized phage-encoded protein n=2 Tax=Pandoraea pulmonicola TaxID=93221 RepID=A0AAJ4ZD25_PANPU|nr:phage regulatory protein/antirepressor Ant [Pandoraea pulmonicola]SUA91214.1 Uncharacterized phage-encoded protein [Pandoraea pulmonicola]